MFAPMRPPRDWPYYNIELDRSGAINDWVLWAQDTQF